MTGSRPTGQARGALPTLLCGVLVVGLVGLVGLVACAPPVVDPLASPAPVVTSTAGAAPRPSTPARTATPRPEDAQTAVDRLFAAGVAGDAAAWDARVLGPGTSFGPRAALLLANLQALHPARLRLRLTGAEQKLPADRRRALGPGARVVQAALTWRLRGETADAASSVWLTLVPGPLGFRLAGTDDGTGLDTPALPLWWSAPVTRTTKGDATVLVGQGQDAGRWARLAQHAATDARRHLPRTLRAHWDGRLVVEVPGSAADFARVLGATPDAYTTTAAVTRPEGPTTRAAVRVVVNPATVGDTDDELGTTLTHEAVHVATRSAASPAPLWAVEGLAEYVALASHPGQRPAELAALHSAPLPSRLPSDAAFTAGGKDVTAAYAQAWLACTAVAGHRSRTDLGRFYASLDHGASVDRAARSALGVDDAVLVGWWRDAMASASGRG